MLVMPETIDTYKPKDREAYNESLCGAPCAAEVA